MKLCTRTLILLFATSSLAACELVGDIFQIGFVVGAVIVLLCIAVISWLGRRFRN